MSGAFIAYLSISLIQKIIPFRLIEIPIAPIVKSSKATTCLSPNRKEKVMSIFTRINQIIRERRRQREQINTALLVSSLPRGMQKDFGWPDGEGNLHRRLRNGNSATQLP
ncbi:MAG: hypothetical protein WBA44_07605 [Mesorhizobium sp.]